MDTELPALNITTEHHNITIYKTPDHQFELHLHKGEELVSTTVSSSIYELINEPMFKEEEFKSFTKDILLLNIEGVGPGPVKVTYTETK